MADSGTVNLFPRGDYHEFRQGTGCARSELPSAHIARKKGADRDAKRTGAAYRFDPRRVGLGFPGFLQADRQRVAVAGGGQQRIHFLSETKVTGVIAVKGSPRLNVCAGLRNCYPAKSLYSSAYCQRRERWLVRAGISQSYYAIRLFGWITAGVFVQYRGYS